MVVFGGVLGWFPGWKGRGAEKWQVDNFIGHFCPSPVPKKTSGGAGGGGAGQQSDPFPEKKHRRDGGKNFAILEIFSNFAPSNRQG